MRKITYLYNMKTAELERRAKEIPASFDSSNTLTLINELGNKLLFSTYITILKQISKADNNEIAAWLNITAKTLGSYKDTKKIARPLQMEQVITLISLFKHGIEIFGTAENFKLWLNKENFYFDKKAPSTFMSTISGIKFIDDRLTGLEFGDNA